MWKITIMQHLHISLFQINEFFGKKIDGDGNHLNSVRSRKSVDANAQISEPTVKCFDVCTDFEEPSPKKLCVWIIF